MIWYVLTRQKEKQRRVLQRRTTLQGREPPRRTTIRSAYQLLWPLKVFLNTLPFFSSSSTLAATSASPNSSHFSDKRRVVRVGIGVAVAVGVGVWLVETASRRNEIGFDLLNFPTNGVKSRRTAVDKLAGKVETPVTAMEMLVNSAAHKRYRE